MPKRDGLKRKLLILPRAMDRLVRRHARRQQFTASRWIRAAIRAQLQREGSEL